MIPVLYKADATNFTTYGIGTLADTISCEVTEERNGAYECVMKYPITGAFYTEIRKERLIKAKPNDTSANQVFRIYRITKPLNGIVTIYAQHISYDLSGRVITSGTAGSCTAACALLTAQAGNFTITTDKTVSADFNIDVPSSVRSWFGGKSGSILDVYGPGEWKYDNFSAEFLADRGADRGVTIRYGKNLTELSQTLDMSNLVSSVIPYYKDNDGNVTTGAAVSTGLVGITKEVAVDFSSSVDPESATPIVTQLATLAASYVANNNLTQIKDSITLDFVPTKELSERVDLCDTVHIYFEPLGLTATAKCIETVWDVLAERYTSTTFGDPKTNITDTIVATQKAVEDKPSTSEMENAVEHATEKITGNLGGYVILHDSDGNGEPDEILIMDTADIATATNVWRWNSGGLGFSPNGYAGPYNAVAIDMQGRIVADAITTGTFNANLIKAGVISDVQGNSTIDMTNGEAKMKNFKAIEDFQLLDVNNIIRAVLEFGVDGASFKIKNTSGNAIITLQEDIANGGGVYLRSPSGDDRGAYIAGLNGGLLELYNMNADRSLTLFNEANGGGRIHVYDKGSGEAEFVVWNKDGHTAAIMQCTSGSGMGGRFEADYDGSEMATMRANSNGGVIDIYDSTYMQIQLVGNGGVVRCVTVQQTSSRKVKENIKPMEAEEARKILDLEAVSFDYKNKASGTNKRGFIAEDVAEVLPNLVTAETEELPASLDYIGMIPYLQAMIKEQEKRIEALEKKLNDRG